MLMKLSLAVALVPMFAIAGIKYWDNPEYKAFDVDCYVQGDLIWNYDGIRNVGKTADGGTGNGTAAIRIPMPRGRRPPASGLRGLRLLPE